MKDEQMDDPMNNQGDLFNPPAARAARDAAIEQVRTGASTNWLQEAADAVLRVARAQPDFTADDVWRELGDNKPAEPRALGAVMRDLSRAGRIRPTTEFRQCARPAGHCHPVRVWTLAEDRR